ncbi:MAG: DUF6531 domain-containing protein, partial [Azoarcus sp.]|nr:DUF6531 domain-containing protein [Azoarcus sp.]
MSGKPAARMGDGVANGIIVQGSATVLIGSAGGVACSVCPGGMAVGSPVNPALGAKVLSGEVDFALPSAMLPLAWQRTYSSYVNAEHGGVCGVLGYGWYLPSEYRLVLEAGRTLLFDAQGRTITFDETLSPGGMLHSRSEGIWLLRGGTVPETPKAATEGDAQTQGNTTAPTPSPAPWVADSAWQHVPRPWAVEPECIIAASADKTLLWRFSRMSGDPAGPWYLAERRERLGGRQLYTYAYPKPEHSKDGGKVPALLTEIGDGAGRRYRLHYLQLYPAREGGLPGYKDQAGWQADNGWRLAQVNLIEGVRETDPDPLVWTERHEDEQRATAHPGLDSRGALLVRYDYSAEGDLIRVTDRYGEAVRAFAYKNHLMIAHRYRGGPLHRYIYEAFEPGAKVIEQHNEEGLSYTFAYREEPRADDTAPARSATLVTDSLGRRDAYHFTGQKGLKRLIRHERPDGSAIERRYNPSGQLTGITDPLGRQSVLWRDGDGRLTSAQDPAGHREEMTYDKAGQLIAQTDACGRPIRYQYDAWGRLTRITHPDGRHETYTYPKPEEAPRTANLPVRIQDAQGGLKHLQWRETGQLAAYTDCSGKTTSYRHDHWGRTLSVTDALGRSVHYERDARGNLAAVRLPNDAAILYNHDAHGRLTEIVSPEAHRQRFAYDLHNRIIQSQDPAGYNRRYEYDAAGRLALLQNENDACTLFEYDEMDRLVKETGFDGRTQSYQYDAAGQLIARSEDSLEGRPTTRYDYDQSGNLIARHLPATDKAGLITERYRWEKDGQLNGADAFGSRIDCQYDPMGRLAAETQRQQHTDGSQWQWRHQHDYTPLGVRASSAYGELPPIQWLTYGAGHLHGIKLPELELDFERDDLYREISRIVRSPAQALPLFVRDSDYDALGLSEQRLDVGGAVVESKRYRRDALSRLTGIELDGHPGKSLRYAYDLNSRLIGSQHGAEQFHYALDPAGNRIDPNPKSREAVEENWRETVRRKLHDPDFNVLAYTREDAIRASSMWFDNRIDDLEGVRNRYDGAGNLKERIYPDGARLSLYYDGAHRLIYLVRDNPDGSQQQALYAYDGLSRRIYKEVLTTGEQTSNITRYGWDGDRLVHEATETMRTTVIYEPGSFVPVARIEQEVAPEPEDEDDRQTLAV